MARRILTPGGTGLAGGGGGGGAWATELRGKPLFILTLGRWA